LHTTSPLFSIGGNSIESVSSWSHLGHLFNAHLLDDDDILARRNCLIGQINKFLCHFSNVDILVKNALFRVYCSSHYSSELWDLTNHKIEDYCIAWRKGLRKVWKLPNDCSRLNVSVVSNTGPIFDELCRRFTNFIYSCLHCDSIFVQSVALHGISARMNSPIGRNVAFCSTHYNQRISCIGDSKLSSYDCLELCNIRMEQQLVARAVILREVLLIRDGILAFSNDLFDLSDSNDLILLLSS
jgi:hypothetical protein